MFDSARAVPLLPKRPCRQVLSISFSDWPGREEFENEFDGETRPSDHWFAGQDLMHVHERFLCKETSSP